MKKTVIMMMVFLFVFAGMAIAGPKTAENCGCGIGTMIFKDAKDGLVTQVVAATTNGIFGNQTFGISTGTLDCDQPAMLAMTERLNIFVADNMDNVAADIASGQGESLDAIADIAGVPAEKRPQLFAALQTNFDTIYQDEHVMHTDVSQGIIDIISEM